MDRKHSSLRDILGDLTIGSGERKNIVPAENSNRHPKLDESSVDEDDYDDDIRSHSNLLAQLLKDTQRKVNEETVALKKRLVEEKQVALMEAERDYLSKYDRFQSEINSLRLEVRQLQQSNAKQAQQYSELANRAASLSAGAHYVHRSEYSVKKLFDAWRRETMKTRDTERIDRIGSAFSRKYLLEKSFQTMCLNVQRKKNSRLQADAKFKFDSVTNDMVTRYEAEIARLSEDLKDAYLTVEHEQLRRQQLEEDLRRLFLKNMTAMNMEALNLFEHSHSNVQDVLASSMQASSALSDTRETANNQSFANGLQKMSHNTLPSLGVESTQYADSNETTFVNDRSHHEYEKLVASTFIQSPPIYPPVPSGYQRQDEAEETPRPPLHAARASMPNPDSPHTAALRTSSSNLLSELYRANMATTSRLAHMNIPRKYQ